ncbi:IS481 family transposase [Proteinivorax tanatarense]|uniref:IS481 family transposase n=1 Tax=Proteinivorax tanatarense TaxID=1260629 RepID=A0AAU7VII9_9FIRM
MPWEEKSKVDQREEFVNRALTEKISFTDLCAEYGISRNTGYKWKHRYEQYGLQGLRDLSKRPKESPQKLSEDCIIKILNIKHAHPSWGARKIQKIFEKNYPFESVPSESSIKRIFEKAGLVKKRRVKRADTNQDALRQLIQPEKPNDVWSVDFKGWWYSTDNKKCDPLTIRDDDSRYLLATRLLQRQATEPVKEVFEEVFKKYGLPKTIRSDNGTPFAHRGSLLGLTRLSAWWMSLGIIPDRTEVAKPQQNGGHERMHRDLKAEVQKINNSTYSHNQKIVEEWRREFNHVRPHEALDYQTPSDRYTPSEIKYNDARIKIGELKHSNFCI